MKTNNKIPLWKPNQFQKITMNNKMKIFPNNQKMNKIILKNTQVIQIKKIHNLKIHKILKITRINKTNKIVVIMETNYRTIYQITKQKVK